MLSTVSHFATSIENRYMGRTNAIRWLACALLAMMLLTGCRKHATSPVGGHAAYYWSTVFRLSPEQRGFLRDYAIERLYVRYFDVVMGQEGEPMPNATIQFKDTFPQGMEVVPTVFILNECMGNKAPGLAHKIAARILQMNETHDIGNVREVQIDCDWTRRTEQNFFSFMDSLRSELSAKGIGLSSTIRLHQLSQKAPPADRGVLMVYNTGDFTDINCQKPILDVEAVGPYLKNLDRYPLPLSAAYPLFSWQILFRGKKFVGIIHSEDEYPILPTDSIVDREVALEEILKAREMLARSREDIHNEVILYELNDKYLTKFNHNDYEKIFDH